MCFYNQLYYILTKYFSNFSCMFLNPNDNFAIWFTIVTVSMLICTRFFKLNFPKIKLSSRNEMKKHSVTKFQKNLQMDFFSRLLEHFFLTKGHNNFGNKIPFLTCFCRFPNPNHFTTKSSASHQRVIRITRLFVWAWKMILYVW